MATPDTMMESQNTQELFTESPSDDNKESTNIKNRTKYQQCDIYRLFNELESRSALILDVRSKEEYSENHILNSEHFHIPSNFQFTSPQQLMQRLHGEITDFKKKVAAKLRHTKHNELVIFCYGDDTAKFNVLHQLSLIFKLQPAQLQILCHPGFSAFERTFPFLCSKQIAFEESQKATEFSSMLAAIKNKHKVQDDGTFFGKIKSEDRKYPNCIVPDRLYLGNGEHSQDSAVIKHLGITHVVNATLKLKNAFESKGVRYLTVAIDDAMDETFTPHWKRIMQFMRCIEGDDDQVDDSKEDSQNDEQSTKNVVLVHCEMGISRSATIVIAYLMARRKMTLFDAYRHVLERRPVIRPNSAFMKQLKEYEKTLFDGKSTMDRVNKEIRQIYLESAMDEQL